MKRKPIWIFLIAIIAVLPFSCDKNEKTNEEETYSVHFTVFYTLLDNPSCKYSDVGATLFIYYDYLSADLSGYEIDEDGVMTKRESVIYPDGIMETDGNGYAEISPEYPERSVTIFVRSNYYKDRFASTCYLALKSSIYSISQFYNEIVFN